MPTIKPRVTITMTEEQLQKIEDLRFKKRFKNQTQAILALIDAGFETLKTKSTSAEDIIAQNHDRQMTKKYHALDDHGKKMVDFVLNEESKRINSKKGISDLMYDDYELSNTIQKAAQTPVPYTLEDSKDVTLKK